MPRHRAIRRFNDNSTKKAPVLTPKQLKRLLFVAGDTRNPERNQLIVWLLFAAAFRITEVAVIEIKDVMWKSGKLRNKVVIPAKYCKNGKAGHVFFYHKKLLKALEAYIQHRIEKRLQMASPVSSDYRGLRKDSKLILSENKHAYSLKRKKRVYNDEETGKDIHKDHWACDTLQNVVSKWGREAGIKGFTTHSGRRTLATRIARRGGDERLICTLLRHTTEDTIYEYIDPDFDGIRKTLEALYSLPDDEIDTTL